MVSSWSTADITTPITALARLPTSACVWWGGISNCPKHIRDGNFIYFFPLLCRSAVWISGWWRRSRSTITDSRRPSNILAEAPGARWPGTGCGCLARAQRPLATWGGVYLTGKWQVMVLGGSLHLLVRMLLVVLGEPHSGYGKGTRWKGSPGLCYLGLRLGGAGE